MCSRKVLTVFQCFSLGPLSFWQAFSNFLAIYRISGCMGITRGKTNIHRKHLLPKILFIPHPLLSSPLCFSFLKSEGLRRLKRLNIQARGGRGHQHPESPGTSHQLEGVRLTSTSAKGKLRCESHQDLPHSSPPWGVTSSTSNIQQLAS